MLLSGEQKCTGTETQSSSWGFTKACVSSALGTYGPVSGRNVLGGTGRRVRPSFL